MEYRNVSDLIIPAEDVERYQNIAVGDHAEAYAQQIIGGHYPAVIDAQNIVLNGAVRVLAAKHLGCVQVPVIVK